MIELFQNKMKENVLLMLLLGYLGFNQVVLGDSVSCVNQPGVTYITCGTGTGKVIPLLECCKPTVYSGKHIVEYQFNPGAMELVILAGAMEFGAKIQIRKNLCDDGSCKIIQIDETATFPLTIPMSGGRFSLTAGGHQFSMMFYVTNQPSSGCRCPVNCANGWTPFEDHCYKYSSVSDGAFDLNAHCHTLHYGAHLASVHSQEEHDFLRNMLINNGSPAQTFIGLYDIKQGNVPRGWEWMDGTDFVFSKWFGGANAQPNDFSGVQDCAEMRAEFDFEWNDEQCSRPLKGLCKHGQPTCATGWLRFDGACYKLTSTKNGFTQMNDHCSTLHPGARLASVHSQDEHDYLRDVLIANGITDDNVWVGLFDVKQGVVPRDWQWTDGSDYDSTHWHGSQPDDSSGDQDCVEMRPDNNYNWDDIVCNSQNLALCKYNIVQCADGWTQFENSCYKVTTVSNGFNALDSHCGNLHAGAHLSSVHSDEEHYLLKALLKDAGVTGNAWVGLFDVKLGTVPRGWEWTDGSSYTFDKWYGGTNAQPNDFNGNQDCSQMREEFDYEWNDASCNINMPGVCKYNIS